MTFQDYIKNPMGTKNAVFSGRDIFRQRYEEKWKALKLRENGIVTYRLYISKTDYIAHFMIPSEEIPKFYYDVVIRFFPPKGKSVDVETTLDNYEVQFFTNDPAFVFTFAHAFKKNNLLFSDLNNKMSKLALKNSAVQRNPYEQVGYVKTIFFAYLEMRQLGMFNKRRWDGLAHVYNKGSAWTTVMRADDKIQERQKAKEAIARGKRNEKTKSYNQARKMQNDMNKKFQSPNIKDFGHMVNPMNIVKNFGHFKKKK